MKIIHLFILLLSLSFAKAQSGNLIRWNAVKKITIEDFRAPIESSYTNAALTNTSIKMDMGYNSSGFTYKINCFFDKSKSWMRVKNGYVLAHEQVHFDISELYARKLNKAMKEYKFNQKTVGTDLPEIYQRIMTEHEQVQKQYDSETDHSLIKDAQQRWSQKISEGLKEYSAYAGY
ncbi:DUF922 domain-containing protein [Pinibacter soli]|uniref:DUF922 domain-containing protein n=1 Tax=Pinibacter soli TaxID=3044211 RepID=A0ABT6RI28_9BACT|nr:DUF922 domain-containing protein [Pinibacter soli]MDI3322220.1 DUF922 domain-containing protein [Pinibacter soli]